MKKILLFLTLVCSANLFSEEIHIVPDSNERGVVYIDGHKYKYFGYGFYQHESDCPTCQNGE